MQIIKCPSESDQLVLKIYTSTLLPEFKISTQYIYLPLYIAGDKKIGTRHKIGEDSVV